MMDIELISFVDIATRKFFKIKNFIQIPFYIIRIRAETKLEWWLTNYCLALSAGLTIRYSFFNFFLTAIVCALWVVALINAYDELESYTKFNKKF